MTARVQKVDVLGWNKSIVNPEKGNYPHPRCTACNTFVPWVALNRRHINVVLCTRGTYCKRKGLAEDEARAGEATELQAYGMPLETVTSFK